MVTYSRKILHTLVKKKTQRGRNGISNDGIFTGGKKTCIQREHGGIAISQNAYAGGGVGGNT